MNANLKIDSYHKFELQYRFVSQMNTQIWYHIMNANLIKNHITHANQNMDSNHEYTSGYGFISQMQT